MNKLPASVPILTILGMVFAGFGILGAPCGLCVSLKMPSPFIAAMNADPLYLAFLWIASSFNFLLCIFLFFASLAAFHLKPAGRLAMLVYAGVQLVNIVIVTLLQAFYVIPKMYGILRDQPNALPSMIGGIASTALALFFGVALPLAILICLTRKNVVAAFHAAPAEKAANALA